MAPMLLMQRGVLSFKEGKFKEARPYFAQYVKRDPRNALSSYYLAVCTANLGDHDRAFEYLEKAYANREWLLTGLRTWPYFDPLRSDPRFDDLYRRIGFPPA